MGVDIWNLPEEMEEEEKEAERQFRANEIIIARRLVAVVATNFAVWLPLIIIGLASLAGHEVSDVSFDQGCSQFHDYLGFFLHIFPAVYCLNIFHFHRNLWDLVFTGI